MVQHTRTYEMATHTSGAQRRKGGASKGIEGLMELPMHMNIQDDNNSNVNNILQRVNHTNEPSSSGSAARSSLATVKRNKFGTGPFDEHWLNVDCCGLFCAGVTYILHLYGVYAINFILLPPWMSATDETGLRSLTWGGHFHRLAFTSTAVLAIYSHFKAMTTDPGAVPPDAQPLEEPPVRAVEAEEAQPPRKGKRLCRRCNAFKPKRAHHCSVCRRCIIKMDHHCPWVNNCVGIGNHKYFLLFVFYTFISCVYSLSLVIARFMSCMHRQNHVMSHHMACVDKPTQLVNVLGLVVEGVLFGLFTACMIIDQSSVVTSKVTSIDRLKGDGEDISGSSLSGVVEVFGANKLGGAATKFRSDWLSPFVNVCFPSSLHDEIMGFCRPCMRATALAHGKEDTDERSGGKVVPGSVEIV